MANLNFVIDNDFTRMIERLENVEEIAPKILHAGGSVLLTYVKRGIIANGSDKSHQLYRSMNMKVFKGKHGGFYATVNPLGYSQKYMDKDGNIKTRSEAVANARKLIAIEYGTRKQYPKPFMQKAINDAKSEIEKVMQQVFEEEVNGR